MSGVLVLYYSIEPEILDVRMVRSLASLSILVTLGSFVPRDLPAWIRKDDHIEGKRERHEARHLRPERLVSVMGLSTKALA